MNKKSKNLMTALNYAKAHSLSVVLMHSSADEVCSCYKGADCDTPGKHPDTLNGVKDATKSSKTIKQWWADKSDANIGIATGNASGIIVLDIDPRNGGNETLKRLKSELGELPATVTSNTGGGGKHLVFCYPNFPVRKDSAGKLLGAGVDILSDGAIMVAPPSRHASGNSYRWAEGQSFDDVKPAPLPDKWLAKLRVANIPDSSPASQVEITEGSRNNNLTSLAGILRRNGLSADAILAALQIENTVRCKPPLDEAEVKKVADSIAAYPSHSGKSDDAELLMQLVLARHFNEGKHLIFGSDGQFWHYSGRMWERVDVAWIEGRIFDTIENSPPIKQQTSSLIGQVRKLLSSKLATRDDLLGFAAEPLPVLNCLNGEVWISPKGKLDLRPHSPASHLRHCLNVNYDAMAKCPIYDRTVLQIFAKSKNPKRLRRFWNELVGYLIQPKRNLPMILILLGRGANGKTLLTTIMSELMGKHQVHAHRVEELEKNRFAMGSLFGKLLFLDDDVRAGARLPDGILKTISEAKEVTGENKYGPQFNFVVRAVPMLLCNNVPSLADVSHGMLRRIAVIPFEREFSDTEKDSTILERIRDAELSGVLNRSLNGYIRVLRRGRFKLPSDITEATTSWVAQANPVPAFIAERCKKRLDKYCWVKDLYAAYKDWATESGYSITQNQQSFRRNLEHLGYKSARGNAGQKIEGLMLRK